MEEAITEESAETQVLRAPQTPEPRTGTSDLDLAENQAEPLVFCTNHFTVSEPPTQLSTDGTEGDEKPGDNNAAGGHPLEDYSDTDSIASSQEADEYVEEMVKYFICLRIRFNRVFI